MKTEGHLGRCYLKGRAGDAANAILTTVGYNFRRILAWLRIFLALMLASTSPLRVASFRRFRVRPSCRRALALSKALNSAFPPVQAIVRSLSETGREQAADVGAVGPAALAVFMLMTNSNLDDCSIGRSEGFAPLRI